MDEDGLRSADRRALGYGLAGSLLMAIGGAFWALPHIEDELDEEALGVASYTEAEGFDVEWNGRDGYLTVPAGTEVAMAETVAADLADISGTRDVEIAYTGARLADPATEDAAEPATDDAADDDAVEPDAVPAEFSLTWGADGRSADGTVPADRLDALGAGFGVDAWFGADDVTLGDDVADALAGPIVALIDSGDLVAGRLDVDGDGIRLVGDAADAEAAERIEAALAEVSGAVDATITVPDVAADFEIEWGSDGVAQTGAAPSDLADSIAAFGVAAPDTADGLSVDDDVAGVLDRLAPFVGAELIEGAATVEDGSVTVRGTAASEDALAAVEAALADAGATLDLQSRSRVQDDVDEILELDTIEFELGTATPTAATEAVIDDLAVALAADTESPILVVGHTDAQGSAASNLALSQQRAEAVVAALVDRGIDPERLAAEGRGEVEPIADNGTADGRQRNRRVEIEVGAEATTDGASAAAETAESDEESD